MLSLLSPPLNARQNSLQHSRDAHHAPTEITSDAFTAFQIRLENQSHHSCPENDFEEIDDRVCFQALPLPEKPRVLRQQLVADQHQALGSLFEC